MSKRPFDSDLRLKYIEGISSTSEDSAVESDDSNISISNPQPIANNSTHYDSATSSDSETELTHVPIATKSIKTFDQNFDQNHDQNHDHQDEQESSDDSCAISDIPMIQSAPIDRSLYTRYKTIPNGKESYTHSENHIQTSVPQNQLTQKLSRILEDEFDTELYLKRREIETIKNEINLGLKRLKELNSEYKGRYKQHYTNSNMKHPKRSYVDDAILYAKLDEGPFVRIHCPECNRCNFLNIQGFLNHCRIRHNIEFPSHQEANLICGTPVPESEVPKNHPCRNTLTKPLMNPVPEKLDLDTLKRNYRGSKIIPKEGMGLGRVYGIKVYDEDVDIMEDDYPLNKMKRINIPTAVNITQTPAATPSPKDPPPTLVNESQNSAAPENAIIDESAEDTLQNEGEELTQPVQVSSPTSIQVPTSITCTTTKPSANYQLQHNGIPDHGSRFYIKKRIIIGNVSKYICPLDGQTSQPLFKWMVYVSGTTYDLDLTAYVRQVRFFLHPSYAPNDVIDLTSPPFHLTRYGWGEFPVRIQFFFHDDAKNNPVSFIHMLRLDWGQSGEQKLGGEVWLDLELDRNTKFLNGNQTMDIQSISKKDPQPKESIQISTKEPDSRDVNQSKNKKKSPPKKKLHPSDFGLTLEAHLMCLRHLDKFPIITSNPPDNLPYRTASNWIEFNSWDSIRRNAIEWYRAHVMKQQLLCQLDTLDLPSQTSVNQLTTRYLLNWLRYFDHPFKPLRSKINLPSLDERRVYFNFCKVCGKLERLDNNFRCESEFCKDFGLLTGGLNSISNREDLYSMVKLNKLKTIQMIKLEASGELEEGELVDDDLIVIDSDNEELEVDHSDSNFSEIQFNPRNELFLSNLSPILTQSINKPTQNELRLLNQMIKPLKLRFFTEKHPSIVNELLLSALKVFIIKLIKGSMKCYKQLSIHRKDEEDLENETKSLLTPIHTYQYISNTPELTFLTNQFFGLKKDKSNSIGKEL